MYRQFSVYRGTMGFECCSELQIEEKGRVSKGELVSYVLESKQPIFTINVRKCTDIIVIPQWEHNRSPTNL